LAARAVEFTEYHPHEGADLLDQAWSYDRRADLRDATHHRVAAEDRDQPFGGVDAVLQWDNRGMGADQRLDVLARAFDVPELDAEQHDVDRTDRGGIVGCLRWHQMAFAATALDLQAMAFHGGQMRAAGDEGDVGASLGQRHTKPAANTSGTDNRNTHGFLLITPGDIASLRIGDSAIRGERQAVDLPEGANHSMLCPALWRKIFLFSSDANHLLILGHPVPR
jgi:hypothetical protein